MSAERAAGENFFENPLETVKKPIARTRNRKREEGSVRFCREAKKKANEEAKKAKVEAVKQAFEAEAKKVEQLANGVGPRKRRKRRDKRVVPASLTPELNMHKDFVRRVMIAEGLKYEAPKRKLDSDSDTHSIDSIERDRKEDRVRYNVGVSSRFQGWS